MPYLVIENFAAGLDTRKQALALPPGTLVKCRNAAISPGGEIEKRRAWVKIGTLTGTFGLAATESTLYAFTRNVDVTPPAFPISGVTLKYQKIPNSSATLMQSDYDVFDGKIYLACLDTSGTDAATSNPHYYDGAVSQGSGHGYYIRTYQSKIYAVSGKFLNFSAVNTPTDWTTGTGAGYINLSLLDADSEFLTSLEVYYGNLSIFSSEGEQLWAVDPDPLQNSFVQLLRGTGTTAPRSTQQYGSGDVLFLSVSGIRSLRARDSSNSAAVSDIGSPLDGMIRDMFVTHGPDYMSKAIAVLEPVVGRFWLVFPSQILVLSYFPGPKITAWSVYDTPAPVDHVVTSKGHVFLRCGDDLYVYGGVDNATYDNCGVEVRLPYLNNKQPGHNKVFEAIDATISGTWRIAVSYDFNNPNAEETLATLSLPTWNTGRVEMTGYASHFSLRFYNEDANAAILSNVAIHFHTADDEA